jgi:hypothetical protein
MVEVRSPWLSEKAGLLPNGERISLAVRDGTVSEADWLVIRQV